MKDLEAGHVKRVTFLQQALGINLCCAQLQHRKPVTEQAVLCK